MAQTSRPKVLPTLLALLAAVALLGACGGDDEKDDDASTEVDPRIEEPCGLVDLADLSQVTGITFDASEPGESSCTFTSAEGLSALTLNLADLNGVDAKVALDQARTACDADTVKELELTAGGSGFACVVSAEGSPTGLATLAVTGDGMFSVLTGVPLAETIDDGTKLQELATLLETGLTE